MDASAGRGIREIMPRPGNRTVRGVVSNLSEDWISVIIGLILVVLVWLLSPTGIPWPLFGVLK